MKGVPEWFMALWCVIMPLTTLLIIPSVQGTIPAYALAFVSVLLVILSHNRGEQSARRIQYITITVIVAGIWFLLLCGSQLGHLMSGRHDFGDMFLNSQEGAVSPSDFYPDSLSGRLSFHRPILPFLFSRGMDALRSMGSVVSRDLRDL
jgi:hypothetical protein